ncbi:MAG: aldo/keto reductase [Lachnospiraceae bacterium]|nr:aldo/keto reductase [Lachnospiraceae bacterium]MDD3614908.1 aldo/keto reductase [Lachnospiraceae bacterium]
MAENQWITLNNQQKMPLLGLGVYKSADGEVESAIKTAVDCGYRLIDTASVYKNEDGVGRGIRKCSVSRSELFITTKVWNTAQRMGDIEGAFNRSLERLNLDYVDLYLVHWPVPGCYLNTWKELEKLYASGRAKSIGVSNFSIQNLEDLSRISDIVPVVNQIEYHPLFVQDELLAYCQEHNIVVQAYAPLARGAYLTREPIMMLANKYGKTPAQIGLRWSVQKGVSVIPKSTKVDRIIGNGQIFDFELTESEIELLNGMNENFRSASIPEDML